MTDPIQLLFLSLILIAGIAAFISGGIFLFQSVVVFHRKIQASLNMDLEVVRVTLGGGRKQGESGGNPEQWKEEIGAMEQLLSSLAGLKKRHSIFGNPMGDATFSLEMANPSNSEEIFFYISFPRRYREAIEKQIHSFFPDALIEQTLDYTIFTPDSEHAVSSLVLKSSSALPLLTYEEMDVDPMNEISNALSRLETIEEGAAIQFLLTPAGDGWRSAGRNIAHKMQQGKQLKDVHKSIIKEVAGGVGKGFLDVVASGGGKRKDQERKMPLDKEPIQLTPDEQELVKAIEQKTRKGAFFVNIRLLASAKTRQRADQILGQMENAFGQFERADINYLVVKKRIQKKTVVFDYIMRTFNERNSVVLGVEELAGMFHFPISTTQTPKIKWLKAGAAPPPTNVPKEGLALGYNDYRGTNTDIRLSDSDRRRHLYVIGQTGTGKSAFLEGLAKQDIANGKGMCFIDPHGDAIESLLASIPAERLEDVVHFDPSDMERPFGLNMLEYHRPEEKTFVINEMINIFDKLYDLKQTGGPMFEQYMRNAMLLVMEDPESGSTLMEIPKVLADDQFRRYKLTKCGNPIVKDFWQKEAEKAGGEASLANMVPYITSKLTQFIANDMMRPIISQQVSTIDFRKVMDEGKILLINLSKGKIGETNSYLLGMVIVGKLLMAALSRVDMPEATRRDFYLYIDEFQNVTTDSISQILSEARKYRLDLTIAHQFIGQLSEDISKAVFGNVGSMASFRVGPEDAEFLEKQFEPIFTSTDLVNADNRNCFVRALINNESTKPFNMKTYDSQEGRPEQVEVVKELSRLRYGRDKDVVKHEIEARLNRANAPSPPPAFPKFP